MATVSAQPAPTPRQQAAAATATSPAVRNDWLVLLATVLGGAAFWACFFPLNQGWLGWVALLPFVHLTTLPSSRRTYFLAFLGGLTFGIPAVHWVRHSSPEMVVAWAGLALLLALHFPLFVFCTKMLAQGLRLPLFLAAPTAWVFLEYLRGQIDIGFAWYYLGHTQHDYAWMVQAADVFGAYGLSFLLLLVNVVLYQSLRAWWTGRAQRQPFPWRNHAFSAALALGLVLLSLAYGAWRWHGSAFVDGPLVALVQGNLSMEIKNDPNEVPEIALHYAQLANEAGAQNPKPDLVIWPETSYPYGWMRVSTEVDLAKAPAQWQVWHQESDVTGKDLAFVCGAPALIGMNTYLWSPEREAKLNSCVLLDKEGKELGRYDKCCRVPFGEYLPFRDTLPFMKYLSPYDFDYSIEPGRALTLFQTPGEPSYRFATLICYEDTVPSLARAFMIAAQSGPPIDFFVNSSNDGWFKCSEEHEQHLVGARFRAIECRRAMARAVNMGISAVIDGNGQIVALPAATWSGSKGITAVVTARIPIDHRASLYVFWGDVLPILCGVLVALALVIVTLRRWRRTV